MHAKTIGLIAHTAKSGVAELINAISREFGRFSISVLFEKETARIAGKKSGHSVHQRIAKPWNVSRETGSILVSGRYSRLE